jgi:hypothetical protein
MQGCSGKEARWAPYLWRQISANIHVDINSTCFRIEVNFKFHIKHIKLSMPL